MAESKRAKRTASRGFSTRTAERQARMRQRVSAAVTAEEQLAAAFDWFRSSARHLADAGERSARMRAMAETLAREAQETERRDAA